MKVCDGRFFATHDLNRNFKALDGTKIGLEKRGLLEKGLQKSPLSRDSREFEDSSDSSDSRKPPD